MSVVATAFNKLVLEAILTETRQCLIQTSSSVVKCKKKQTHEWRELLEHVKPAVFRTRYEYKMMPLIPAYFLTTSTKTTGGYGRFDEL